MRAPLAFSLALIIAAAGVFGAWRLPSLHGLVAGSAVCVLAHVSSIMAYYADHRRWVRDPTRKIVADRWQVIINFAGFRWTHDKNFGLTSDGQSPPPTRTIFSHQRTN